MEYSSEQPVYKPAPRENRKLNHLPGSYGWPIFGRTFGFLMDPLGMMHRMYERYGNVSRSSAFFQRGVNLVGPDANQLLLQDRDKIFSSRMGWDSALGLLFPRGLMLRDFDDHRFHRRIMQEAFRKEALASYIEMMNPVIEAGLRDWGRNNQMLFYPAIKKLTLDIAAVVFMGLKLGPEADRLNQAFIDSVQAAVGISRYPIPGTAMWRGVRGRRYLQQYMREMIPAKRASNDNDLFARICRAEDEDGQKFDDEEIIDHMIFLMMAAHDTTTSAMSTMVRALVQHPEWQHKLREEARTLGKARVDHEDLDHFRLTGQVLQEAMRLYPPVIMIPRRAVREFEFEGYSIPANSGVVIYPALVHRLPQWWTEPDKFDPDRFSEARAEHKQHPFLYVPFGGGAHTCIGMHFAEMMVKAIMPQFLDRYQVSAPVGTGAKMLFIPIPKPKDRLPINIEAAPPAEHGDQPESAASGEGGKSATG